MLNCPTFGVHFKVRLALILFVLLMESGSKYSILEEEKFLSGHPLVISSLHMALKYACQPDNTYSRLNHIAEIP